MGSVVTLEVLYVLAVSLITLGNLIIFKSSTKVSKLDLETGATYGGCSGGIGEEIVHKLGPNLGQK